MSICGPQFGGNSKAGAQLQEIMHEAAKAKLPSTTCPVYVRLILTAGLPRWDGAYLCRQLVLGEDPVELNWFQRWVLARQSPPTHLVKTKKDEWEKIGVKSTEKEFQNRKTE